MTSIDTSPSLFNIPARILGWAPEGGASVELLTNTPFGSAGRRLSISLRPNPRGNVFDFDFHRKRNALRVGGVVLLRKLMPCSDSEATIKELDVITVNPNVGTVHVLGNTAVSLLPPSDGEFFVSRALIALIDKSIRCKSIASAASAIEPHLDEISHFGTPGLILTGEIDNDELVEVVIGDDTSHSVDELIAALKHSIDGNIISSMKKSRNKWQLIPFFKASVEEGRTKITAQRMNASGADQATAAGYGRDGEYSWTITNCVMMSSEDGWVICDVSPCVDTSAEPKFIIDLIKQ